MNFIYFDGSSGISGDMILGALLDAGVPHDLFQQNMAKMKLPVDIRIKEIRRGNFRGLKVDIDVRKSPPTVTRKWKDIEELIANSPFSDQVKGRSLSIFKRLFSAEAHVHGRSFSRTHLHEAGADDAVIDIVGCCFLADVLQIETFYSSPLNLGKGWIESSHGHLPVPPPAVGELLKGVPVYSALIEKELVTPTGAAIVSTLASSFFPFPEMVYERIGYGAGSHDFPDFPNILRVFLGKKKNFNPAKKVFVIEANIDDTPPQILSSYLDTALKKGALDVSLTPVVMKKSRLATRLTVLAETEKLDLLVESIFRETSTIGVRLYPVERRVLERKKSKIKVMGEDISIKTATLRGETVNVQPEYEECLRLAKKLTLPIKSVEEKARYEYHRSSKSSGTSKKEKIKKMSSTGKTKKR